MGRNDYGKTPNVWQPSEVPPPFTGHDLGVGAAPRPGIVTTTTVTEYSYPPSSQSVSGEWVTLDDDEDTDPTLSTATQHVHRTYTIPPALPGTVRILTYWRKKVLNANQTVSFQGVASPLIASEQLLWDRSNAQTGIVYVLIVCYFTYFYAVAPGGDRFRFISAKDAMLAGQTGIGGNSIVSVVVNDTSRGSLGDGDAIPALTPELESLSSFQVQVRHFYGGNPGDMQVELLRSIVQLG